MKKKLVLGLCLLGSCGVWASENYSPDSSEGTVVWRSNPNASLPTGPMELCVLEQGIQILDPSKNNDAMIQQSSLYIVCSERIGNECGDPESNWTEGGFIKACLANGEEFLLVGCPYDESQLYIKKGAHVILNLPSLSRSKTISDMGSYLCTHSLSGGKIERFHLSIESGSITMPTDWLTEKEPSLAEVITQ